MFDRGFYHLNTNWPSIQGHTQAVNLITDTALFETALRFFFFGSDGLAKLLVDEWTQIFSNSIKFVISAFLDSLGRWLKAAFKLCARARCPLGTNANTPRYPLGTSVNTTYIQVPSLEFGHSDGDRVQGQVQCRGPDTTRTQKWVPGTSLCHCVHEIFFSSGGSGSTALCTMASERSKWSNNVHIHLHTRAGLFKAGLR